MAAAPRPHHYRSREGAADRGHEANVVEGGGAAWCSPWLKGLGTAGQGVKSASLWRRRQGRPGREERGRAALHAAGGLPHHAPSGPDGVGHASPKRKVPEKTDGRDLWSRSKSSA